MWGWAIISFLLSWMTLGFSNLIFLFLQMVCSKLLTKAWIFRLRIDNFKFQICICIIIGSIMIINFSYLNHSIILNLKLIISNLRYLLDDEEYKINTKSEKKIKPKII